MWLKFRSEAEKALQDALGELKISSEKLYLEVPPAEGDFGDLASSICLVLANDLGRKPHTIARDVQTVIQGRLEGKKYKLIEKVEVAGPGYLNFFMALGENSPKIIGKILDEGENYGKVDLGKGKKTLVEHTSANPDGPLHIGHLRNSILGDTISRILKFTGHEVITESYVNDCGRLMAIACWEYQKERSPPETGKKGDEWVVGIYIRGNKRIEKVGPEDAMKILREYEKGSHVPDFHALVNAALDGHKETLQNLGIEIDEYIWESTFIRNGTVNKLVQEIEKSKKAIKDKKLLALDLSEEGFRKEFMIRRSDGSLLYSAKDLAHHFYYKTSKADRSVIILGADHKLHYAHMKTALKLLKCKSEFEVVHYEFISLPEGQMSTRKGNYIAVDDLVAEAKKRAYEEVKTRRRDLKATEKEKIANAVAVGALRYAIASVSPEKPIMFSWDAILDFEKSSAPALQYTFARITRILEKTKKTPSKEFTPTSDPERSLLLHLAKFPEVVTNASESLRPHLITGYASELNNLFKDFYSKCKVIGSKEEPERLALVKATKQTMENILNILGIPALEKM